MKCIRLKQYGAADNLEYLDHTLPYMEQGQAVVDIRAVGVNFIDIYHRTGLYPLDLPITPGVEGAGIVSEIDNKYSHLKRGDRVAFVGVLGSYAEKIVVPCGRLVKVPDNISFETAAAAMLQGITAHYLITSTHLLAPSHTILIHAGAGGVGRLLTQFAKLVGSYVITTVSTSEKALISYESGADAVICYTEKDFEKEVIGITNGRGLDVVYDSVAKTTFTKSLNCLAPRGHLVLYGQSSGKAPPIEPTILAPKSLTLTRPSIADYIATSEELNWRATEVFEHIQCGKLNLLIEDTLRLSDANEAQRRLESRKTSGKLVLVP